MTIYIGYEYLAAEQLGILLIELHRMFDEVLYADRPAFRTLPDAPEARLRIETVVTGESITIAVVQGITQVIGSADPAMAGIVGGAAAVYVVGLLLLGILNRIAALRARVLRDNRENDRGHLDLDAKRLELLGQQQELIATPTAESDSPRADLSDMLVVLETAAPDRSHDRQLALAERLKPHLDAIVQIASDENIHIVRVTVPEQRNG
jgi:hypothetical protein